jgi:nucleoside-diphosphate-sugar epimerase
MASILLTGASGYLGAAIGVELRERGIAYDVLPCRLEQLEKKSLPGYEKVIHAAGSSPHRGQAAIELSNRIGTERLLAALDGIPEILFISSRLVYGHQPGCTCNEEDPAQPSDIYGLTKLAAERCIKESRFPHAILRIPGLIGESPAGIGHNFFAEALRCFMSGEKVTRFTPDRMHDNLDVRALAKVCADWANDSCRFPEGVTNITGVSRSLHGTFSEFSAAARRFGGRPICENRDASEMPWPFMSDERFRREVGGISQRSDADIADACCRMLTGGQGRREQELD